MTVTITRADYLVSEGTLVAALVIMDRSARWATVAQLVVVLGFTVIIGWAVPALWLDPLGSLLKNVPILLAILVHGIVGDRR